MNLSDCLILSGCFGAVFMLIAAGYIILKRTFDESDNSLLIFSVLAFGGAGFFLVSSVCVIIKLNELGRLM